MKGIVFTEFFDMVEQKFGYEVVDAIIEQSQLPSNGVYTSIGTYPHSEMVSLLFNLSEGVNIPIDDLLRAFGGHLFDVFLSSYPHFFSATKNSFELLRSIDNHIHVEVKKLYPDATLPSFETFEHEDGTMVMIYQSERKMGQLAYGLIEATLHHFKDDYGIKSENINPDGSKVKFTISPNE